MPHNKFHDQIDKDLAWRKKEISDLFLLAQKEMNDVLLKSLVLLIYAHWEGFIKKSLKTYLKYISDQKIELSQLEKNFHAVFMKNNIKQLVQASDAFSIEEELKFLSKSSIGTKKFKIKIDMRNDKGSSVINTESNLTEKTLQRFYKIVGLNYKKSLANKKQYIDSCLLKNRHIIAHGDLIEEDDEFSLTIEDIKELKETVLFILDCLKEELSDYTAYEFYLKKKKTERNTYETDREIYMAKYLKRISS